MHPSYQAKESGERQVDVWGHGRNVGEDGDSGAERCIRIWCDIAGRRRSSGGAERRRCSRPACDLSGLFICSGDVHNMRQQLDVWGPQCAVNTTKQMVQRALIFLLTDVQVHPRPELPIKARKRASKIYLLHFHTVWGYINTALIIIFIQNNRLNNYVWCERDHLTLQLPSALCSIFLF